MSETKPRRRVLRGVLIGVLVLVVLIVAAGAIGWASFDPNSLKPRIAEAVKRATGRDLALKGPLSLTPGLAPTITAKDVALANIEGGSRPEMATIQEMRISVALFPLLSHRVVIEEVALDHPDILLERNAQGTPNWLLRPDVPAQSLKQATPGAPRTPTRVEISAVRIESGRVTWRDDRGHPSMVDVPNLAFSADGDDAPAHLAGTIASHGVPITVSADTGPLGALQAGKPAQPWPVKLSLAGLGGHATVDGTLADPERLTGYAVSLDGAVPDLAALNRLFRNAHLPSVQDVAFSAHVVDVGQPVPQVSALKLHLGAAHLSQYLPELDIVSLDLADPAPDQPAQLDFKGSLRTVPIALAGTFGPPLALQPGSGKPFSLDLAGHAGSATLAVRGTVPSAVPFTGATATVSAKVPDLASLTPLAGRQLPALKNVDLAGRLDARPGRIGLDDLALSSAQGDLAGGVLWERAAGGRPHVTANLTSKRIDIDAFQAALPPPPPAPPPLQPAPPAQAQAQAQAHSQAAPSGPARVIPDTRLPLDALREQDADMRVSFASVRSGGVDYRNVVGQLALANGHLTVAPVSADTPGGQAQGAIEVDAGKTPPSVGLALHAPELALAPLLAALHQAADATGTVMVDADLHGTGDTIRAIAGTVDGHLGLAMVNGQIDNALLTRSFGKVLSSAHLPAELAGHTDVRCFALRLDARHGLATVSAFALDTTRLAVTGTGTVNLADEALALQMRPLLRLGGNGVAVPVRVGGTLGDPQVGLDALTGGRVGAVIGALNGAAQADACGPALVLARDGRAGPSPAAPKRGGSDVNDLLRMFRSR